MGRKIDDLTGKIFGRLKIISRGPNTNDNKATWNCKCECGRYHHATAANLKQGHSKSCGCIVIDRVIKMSTTHGDSNSKEFRAWRSMRTRCYWTNSKRYKDYGGRGIRVCDTWNESYIAFLSCIGRAPSLRHSLDRIENNGNYEPGNVKWSTPKEQANNRRKINLTTF